MLQIWQQARAADPVLAGALASRLAQQEDVVQARAALLPQASAAASALRTHAAHGDPADGREYATSVVVNQALIDLAARDTLARTRADAQGQDATYRAAAQDLAARVAQAYFDALDARAVLSNTQANEEAYGQQVRQATERRKAGLSAAVDVDQARAYYEGARGQTVAARAALESAMDALAEITGMPAGALKGLRDDLALQAPQPADVQSWIALAERSNPALEASRWSVASAEHRIEAAGSARLPTLSAGVGLGRATASPLPDTNDGRLVASATLTLTVPLFAGGALQSQVRQAVHQREAAVDSLEAERRHVERDVRQRFRDVLAAIAQTDAARAAREAADHALTSTRVGQGLGTQTMTDLLLAIQTLAGARNSYALARHQAVLSLLRLKQAAGTLGESDLAATNDLLQ